MVDEAALDAGVSGAYAKWRLEVELVCTDDDGNLADAAMLAMVAALADTALPVPTLDSAGQVVCDVAGERRPLQLAGLPVPVTHGLAQPQSGGAAGMLLLLDPTREEEQSLCAGGSVTLAFADGQLCLAIKADGGPVSQELIDQCVAAGRARSQALAAQFFASSKA